MVERRGECHGAGADCRGVGHAGAHRGDQARDVGAQDGGVAGDGREAGVALGEVDGVQGDGFDLEEDFVGGGGGCGAVGEG